jgi:hypothetical protein
LRWLWIEWASDYKPWVGLGNSCTPNDHDLFAAATMVTMGNREKGLFWILSWLNGLRPKDIAPLIFKIAKRRMCAVKKALENDFWVAYLNIQEVLSVEHIEQFYKLSEMTQNVDLDPNTPDSIRWKFGKNGEYMASSAYKMQFLGNITSNMPSLVWKPWAPPKCKTFAWLVIQN